MVSDSPYDLVLEMSISCEGIQRPQASTGPDSFVVVYMRESELDDWVCVGMTEVVQNSSKPQYSTKVPVKFDFSSVQHMLFRVHDFDFVSAQNELENHSMLGSYHTEVSSLLKGNLSGARLALDTTGSLVVCIQPSIESTELINYISIVVATKKLRALSHLGSCDAFIKVYRMNPLTARKTAVHKSEVVKSSILPAWQSFILALENFRVGTTEEEELLIEIYDSDACGDVLIGSAKMSIRDLETRPLEILVSGPDGTINGALEIFTRLVHVPNFLEFLSSGYRLNMIFVIDFAEIASIRDPHVQHHLQGAAPNATIKSVMHLGQHVHNYLIKNQLQALGCGTLTSKDANSLPIDVLPLFSADDKDIRSGVASCLPSHICNEVRILLQKYERTVTRCTRAKRTIMTPVIRAVTHLARAHPQAFTIVPIITFGEIDDWNDMVEAILDADLESLSFLFIDLGNSCKLGELFRRDGDYVPLVSQKDGRVLRRSMIQYFQYRIHAQSLRQLTKDIMREIPNMCAQWGLHTGSLMQIQS